MSLPRILIIDDAPRDYQAFRQGFAQEFDVFMVGTPEMGISQIKAQAWDAVLVDLDFGQGYEQGLNEVLPEVYERVKKACPILVVTSDNRPITANIALQKGANDLIRKVEMTPDSLANRIREQIQRFREAPTAPPKENYAIIGHSAAMLGLKARWDRFCDYPDTTVLLLGESGTGKELAARYIHQAKNKPDLPFIAVNLRELNPNLWESELFGHVKGAFTGADKDKTGYLEQAGNGTLFLDEIGEVDETIQIKLLRVLEGRVFSRVGHTALIPLKAQLLFATNKSLEQAMEEHSLRRDFYERISALSFTLPPLRERQEDIEALTTHFLRQYCGNPRHPMYGKTALTAFTEEAWEAMLGFGWPGNIRELSNELRRLAFEADFQGAGLIEKTMLSPRFFKSISASENAHSTPSAEMPVSPINAVNQWSIDKLAAYEELKRIEEALGKEGGRKLEAAKRLGLKNDQTLRYRVHSRYERFPELFEELTTIKKIYNLI